MASVSYETLDATEMAEMVRRGEVEPDHFVKESMDRIERIDPALNAVVHKAIPVAVSENKRGPFAGVPFPLKNIGAAAAGLRVTSGSRLYRDVIGTEDSTLVSRYRAAGLVFIARTNTPELALSFTSEPAADGPCRNPWDLTRSAGGSSGGAAAVVAARIVPMAHSSDGAGSTRVPAAHCGVFGFKPSRMRNPVGPRNAEGIAGMSTPHVISRSVRDSARILDVSSGPDVGDPYAAPAQAGSFASVLGRWPTALRIGLVLEAPDGIYMADECRAAARDAANLCTDLGHHVTLAKDPCDNGPLKRAWRTIAGVDVALAVDQFALANGIDHPDRLLEPINAEWLAEGRAASGVAYLSAVQNLHASSRAMGRFFLDHDIYLSPTTAAIAPPLGTLSDTGLTLDRFYDRFWNHAPLTAQFNASGCPAMSVPLFWTTGGLPVGVQFGAAFGKDAMLFELAAQLEEARPWDNRRPPVSPIRP